MEKIYNSTTKPSSWMKLMPELCTENYDVYYDPFTCGYVRYEFFKPELKKEGKHYGKTSGRHNSGETDQNILDVLEMLGAVSRETAVTRKEISTKGIELGLTTSKATAGNNNAHRWSPRISLMAGVSINPDAAAKHYVPYLHREMMKSKGGRKCLHYWIDKTNVHGEAERTAEGC